MLKTLIAALALLTVPAAADEAARPLPPPALDATGSAAATETAVFAGGCFWGMQGVFQHVNGVKQVLSGYSGGSAFSAQYYTVGSGATGHAESVQIVFDPRVVSFGKLLQVYFSVMDPTTLDYQGPDHGSQYRSEIFAADDTQRRTAQAYIAQLSKAHVFSAPIVTGVGALHGFYPAESYHQDYLIRHPDEPYIVINDLPKIARLRGFYPQLYRERPVTVAQR
ncbi:MAG TPA: peptide-methionine (S)-S-oxide reductase MsrA [Rhizomicrobium sp.]|nr:peptide-methionine (S)-S-oxide reductase MsrA [Rhizomicrobium sp.]